MKRVGIIGAGAWGTALGITSKWAGCDVVFWDIDSEVIDQISQKHSTNTPLKDLKLDPSIKATHKIEEVCNVDIILLVTAAQSIREVSKNIAPHLSEEIPIILCSKGIEQETGALLTDILKEEIPKNPIAVLSGPAFAVEVAQNLPTAVSIAASDMQTSRKLANALTSKLFRLYPTDDVVGVQLGGALKNVLAVASGIIIGMNLGQNAQASLLTHGLEEFAVLGKSLGAKTETFMGLSGLGDMILTCMSMTSRNTKFGAMIGQGMTMDQVKKEHGKLAEGVFTTKAVKVLSDRLGVDLPICTCVYNILYEGLDVTQAMEDLLTRPLQNEAA